jgi:hypothetical protein
MSGIYHNQAEASPTNGSWQDFRRGFARFVLVCAAIWMALYALYASFPYLQSGSDIVAGAKRSYSLTHPLFDSDARIRVLVFGDSKTLAAFNPRIFDARVAQDGIAEKAQSFNEGLPGERRYVVYLEQLLASGIRPTHVLVQFAPIEEDREPKWGEWLRHDKMIVDTLFPFRTLPRDLVLFLFSAVGHGGISEAYRRNSQAAEQVISDRGYFFIAGQSHFAGDRLPDDYRLATDTPDKVSSREVDTARTAFARLSSLADRYDFQVIVFPPVYRSGELAAVPARQPTVVSGFPRFVNAGEDYWLLPPRCFSDPIHTNTGGAEIYSTRLADLLAPLLKREDR